MNLRLKEIRNLNNLSQRKMAQKIGVGKTCYNYYESGERIITLPRLNDICNMYNVSLDYLLGISDIIINPKEKYKIDKKLVGQRLKEIRKENDLSQNDLAYFLNTSQSTISSYENGKTLIITAFLYEISKRLNVSTDYIIGRSNTKKICIKYNK